LDIVLQLWNPDVTMLQRLTPLLLLGPFFAFAQAFSNITAGSTLYPVTGTLSNSTGSSTTSVAAAGAGTGPLGPNTLTTPWMTGNNAGYVQVASAGTASRSHLLTASLNSFGGDALTYFSGGNSDDVSAAALVSGNVALPQLAFGGGWYTALYFTNTNNMGPLAFLLNFFGDDGNPLDVPNIGTSIRVNLAGRGTALIEIPNIGALQQGYVTATLPGGVFGYGVFRLSVAGRNDQEAVVPLSGVNASVSTLLYDDTKFVTGVAVVNLSSSNASITATARDAQANIIGTGSLSLPPNGKTAATLRSIPGLASVAGTVGSVDFTSSGGSLAVLGLRFKEAAFTSIPTSDR
jgi:hypothetical protein